MVMATERRCTICRDVANSSLCSCASVQPMEANLTATPAILSHGSGIRIASTVLPGHCVCLLSQQVRHYVSEDDSNDQGIASLPVLSPIPSGPRQDLTLRQEGIRSVTCHGHQRSFYASDVGQIVILAPILLGQTVCNGHDKEKTPTKEKTRCDVVKPVGCFNPQQPDL